MLPTMNIAQEIYLAIMISFRLTGKLFITMSLLFLSSIKISVITEERVINRQLIENNNSPPGSNINNTRGTTRFTNQVTRKKNKSLYTS